MGQTDIDGVLLTPLKVIEHPKGDLLHGMKRGDPGFVGFGEVYFTNIKFGEIKGWNKHKKMTLNYAVVSGVIKLVLYDVREDSVTKGEVQEIVLGGDNYCLVKIPVGIWNGFTGISSEPAIVANLASEPHDPDEIVRLDPFSKDIPYQWQG